MPTSTQHPPHPTTPLPSYLQPNASKGHNFPVHFQHQNNEFAMITSIDTKSGFPLLLSAPSATAFQQLSVPV